MCSRSYEPLTVDVLSRLLLLLPLIRHLALVVRSSQPTLALYLPWLPTVGSSGSPVPLHGPLLSGEELPAVHQLDSSTATSFSLPRLSPGSSGSSSPLPLSSSSSSVLRLSAGVTG